MRFEEKDKAKRYKIEELLKPKIYFLMQGDEVVYVGQTKKNLERIYTHLDEGVKFFDNFYLMDCDIGKLDETETFYINKYNPKYNVVKLAYGSLRGFTYVRNKIADIGYDRPTLKELKEYLVRKGIKWSETRNNRGKLYYITLEDCNYIIEDLKESWEAKHNVGE